MDRQAVLTRIETAKRAATLLMERGEGEPFARQIHEALTEAEELVKVDLELSKMMFLELTPGTRRES